MLHFPQYFQKNSKLKFFFFLDFFSMLFKNRKCCHDLKVDNGLKGEYSLHSLVHNRPFFIVFSLIDDDPGPYFQGQCMSVLGQCHTL